ncbi:DNA polymerase III subunit delta [Boudabousia liubingyangii]|uniref:DNA polymerase III subunit delta n=1 Tax=Boudabousia liubingyangii TaxID=1921764 RepID=A0A1Q5PN43_9ACTO|nr:DNA polymerase III subunit delta [Boudabousia liubingyangii]OKL47463.1 DNA polymerase III subunit delta [Boudabousia liubingyangii]OKL48885.1 DNA polymerase III subunit delta [Boudabousia liubingyangii]
MAKGTSAHATTWDRVKIAPIVVLSGAEELFAQRAIAQLREQFQKQFSEYEKTTLDASNYKEGELATVTSPSLFAEPRLVIVENAGSGDRKFYQELEKYAQYPADDVCLVLNRGVGRSAPNTFKKLAADYPEVQCPKLKYANELNQFVNQELRRARRSATGGAIQKLVQAAGTNLAELASAITQLISDNQGEISEADVDRHFAGRVETTHFEVADAVIEGKMPTALIKFRQALDTGGNHLGILTMLAKKLREVALYQEDPSLVAVPRFALPQLREAARTWSPRALAGAICAVARADEEAKGASKDPEHAIEKCLIVCCRLKAGKI